MADWPGLMECDLPSSTIIIRRLCFPAASPVYLRIPPGPYGSALGLLRHSQKHFKLPAGYYPLETIFLCIAFLALRRVPSLEALRYEPPGEWGKLLGLDRIPEVRTLRQKIERLCEPGAPVREWSGLLAREWMEAQPESAGTLYIDGHVRVYHGHLTQLPRRYVARQRLCLRGTTDYWVNAMDGQPFFAVSQPADPGLLQVLEEQIVPRLLTEVPRQPDAAALADDRWRARFTLIFDRAGYPPEFFARQWEQRIAVITYHNFFQYMGQHYGLNRLIEYGTEPLPDTTVVVNPAWRKKDQEVRRERAVLTGQQAQFGALSLPAQAEAETVAVYERQKGRLLEQVQQRKSPPSGPQRPAGGGAFFAIACDQETLRGHHQADCLPGRDGAGGAGAGETGARGRRAGAGATSLCQRG